MDENKNVNNTEELKEEPELIKKKKPKDDAHKNTEDAPAPEAEQSDDRIAELEKRIKELEEDAKVKDDKYLRMAAEYDNFRRRSREERDAVYSNAMADTVAELLPIVDNLERAAGFSGDKVAEGLKMISASVATVFEKLGIESFGAPGDTFDPNLHNAVMHEEDEEKGEGEITDVFQKGYKKGSKIIRFAMVKSVN